MTESQQQDVEIYLRKPDLNAIEEWLRERFDRCQHLKSTDSHHVYQIEYQGETFKTRVLERVAGQFTCVWFDHPNLPWKSDQQCAHEAFNKLGVEVRCNPGGWRPDQDPDEWLKVNQHGEETILWRD